MCIRDSTSPTEWALARFNTDGSLDGTAEAARKLERVLTNDPGTGVMRHADAGYTRAIEVARERGVYIPML